MLRVSIFSHNAELTDTFLRQRVALGADAIDFGGDSEMPGVAEQGYPDLEGVKPPVARPGHGHQPGDIAQPERGICRGSGGR